MAGDGRMYSVTSVRGCKVIKGEVPVDEFVALTRAWTKYEDDGEWIFDTLLPAAIGASFVVGPKAACAAWRSELGLVA